MYRAAALPHTAGVAREIYKAPRSWAEQLWSNIVYWNEVDRGGHFAAMERPEIFVNEVRKAFRSFRP